MRADVRHVRKAIAFYSPLVLTLGLVAYLFSPANQQRWFFLIRWLRGTDGWLDSFSALWLLASAILAGGTCGTKPCWKTTGTSGFSMANKLAAPDGITKMKLGAGVAGKAKVQLSGKGANLPMPGLPLVLPVTAQLLIRDGAGTTCFQTTYDTSAVNDGLKFKAKGP